MRIACLPSADLSYESGSVLFLLQLYRHMVSRGHQVVVLGSASPNAMWNMQADDLVVDDRLLEHPVINDRPVSADELRSSFRASLEFLLEQHRRSPLDAVYAQYLSFGSYAAAVFSRMTSVPFFVSCFGRDLTIGFPLLPAVRSMGISAAKRAAAVVVPNSDVFDLLLSEDDVLLEPSSIAVVPSPVDKAFSSSCIRQEYGARPIRILTINSCFKPEKGIDTLLHAFALLIVREPDALLYIAGTDDHPEKIHRRRLLELVKGLGLADRVVFTGYLVRNEVAAHLAQCDIFVDARHVSNFSSVMVEAQFMRAPTIASATQGGREVIVHDVNGLLFEPDDAEMLFAHLLCLTENPSARVRLSNACAVWSSSDGARYREASCFEHVEQLFAKRIARSVCA